MAEREKNFKFAGIQMLVGENKEENVRNALKFIDEAAKNGANLVSLPECFNCPYATKVFEQYSETESGETVKQLSDAAKKNNIWLIGGSIPEKDPIDGKIYNTCFIFNDKGELIKKHRKVHLFDIDVPNKIKFKESETLTPGNDFTVIDIGYCKVGVGICYDIRFAELSMLYTRMGAKMLVFPGSFNLVTGPAHWELLQRGRAVDNQSYVAAVSPARNPDSAYQSWGHSTVVDPWGRILSKTDEHQSIIYADIDLNELNEVRSSIPITVQRRNDLYKLEQLK
ncbi:hypothetical protein DICPUDRAFT_32199 [Dictyostelium purpureum]|uniref:CN hydrolase domain-containing protein n=1 Tax=Dictyostelium purpureum TaxID=5786 RepID=F0ZIN3_DICPU|nr:uncharacterized protein DICPUDRAFT_32199 [Dictyostelium purpureum]EGC36199.1 hypothetical protein DICPUDRAFT_32199 [Dictyostelium purpureum]|eukprot:XP_003287266.1 hypothetical protein DICPUDRAFT_32199 [Dictyostelium purpureum]